MKLDGLPPLTIKGLEEIPQATGKTEGSGPEFGSILADAIRSVDELQKQSETAQSAYAQGAPVELHDVLIRVEEADLAFRTMMEVRNKLIDAYREVMRINS